MHFRESNYFGLCELLQLQVAYTDVPQLAVPSSNATASTFLLNLLFKLKTCFCGYN